MQVAEDKISLSQIWDDYKFTPADALNFFHDAGRLEPYLIHLAVKAPNFWCPQLATRRSPRRQRK